MAVFGHLRLKRGACRGTVGNLAEQANHVVGQRVVFAFKVANERVLFQLVRVGREDFEEH